MTGVRSRPTSLPAWPPRAGESAPDLHHDARSCERIGSGGAIGAPVGISRPSASPASRRRSATGKVPATRSATIDRFRGLSSSQARAHSRPGASRSRASLLPRSSSRAIATDASRARSIPGRGGVHEPGPLRDRPRPVTSYRSRRRIASPISRSRSPVADRAVDVDRRIAATAARKLHNRRSPTFRLRSVWEL